MKKFVIIGLIALVAIAALIKPLFTSNDNEIPVTFEFKDNLATTWNKAVNLKLIVSSDDIKQLEISYNDSIFKSWTNPTGNVQFPFNASYYGLGTKMLQLKATLSDGTIYTEERMVRVLSDEKPEFWQTSIVQTLPHLTSSFTQGLEFNEGQLYESTGQKGESMVAKVDLNSGAVQNHIGLDGNYFGEGITVFKDKIFQITWQEQKCFIYDKKSLQILKDVAYSGEGWGLCNDGKQLIMSDGTERIFFRNPETFNIERFIEVYDDQGPIPRLNELEYVDGKIYANVWMTNSVVVINPTNGKVEAVIDATNLTQVGKGMEGDVLNGIAYNPLTKKTYMTGKKWSKLFEVSITKPAL